MRKVISVLFFVVMAFAVLKAVDVSNHTVVKGDTLWDIAGKYYNDPWKWQAIWNANKMSITNPDLIYPDQSFVIPDAASIPQDLPKIRPEDAKLEEEAQPAESAEPQQEAVVPTSMEETVQAEASAPVPVEVEASEEAAEDPLEEAMAQEPVEEAAAEAPVVEPESVEELSPDEIVTPKTASSRYISAESFVVSEGWKADGHITGDKDKKMLISSGDTVYINLGSNRVKPGDNCLVYRIIGRVKDQNTGEYLGYEVRRIARLELTKGIGDLASAAKVTVSYDPLQIGDFVKIINTSNEK